MNNRRVVSFVDQMSSTYRLHAKRRLAEVHLASSVVEVERRELVANETAADADRQAAEEAQFAGVGHRRSLGVDGANGTDLVTDRVDVHRTVKQPVIL